MVVPLRLIGEELKNNDSDHGTAEQGIVGCDGVALETIGEKEDVRRRGDEPEQNLSQLVCLHSMYVVQEYSHSAQAR